MPGLERDQLPLTIGGLTLRPTRPDDCAFVVGLERQPDNARHVEQWSEAEHRASLQRPGTAHWILERPDGPVGYALLEDVDDPNGSILLRRIVIAGKGRGDGRTGVRLVLRYCFEVARCHRVWLNVALDNRRAEGLYRRLGFVEEGIARESVRKGEGFASMRVLSLLEQEYRNARKGRG
ncbi:GNAT family N-acetyltransferase [Sediminicurvatus halobius]|nr:GNAT family protein [Spiribacter halobius]UEX79364.1 GNAT family N-acetyltransferase [Spiribacter halobius]